MWSLESYLLPLHPRHTETGNSGTLQTLGWKALVSSSALTKSLFFPNGKSGFNHPISKWFKVIEVHNSNPVIVRIIIWIKIYISFYFTISYVSPFFHTHKKRLAVERKSRYKYRYSYIDIDTGIRKSIHSTYIGILYICIHIFWYIHILINMCKTYPHHWIKLS